MGFEVNVEGPRRMFCLLNENGDIVFSLSESVVTGWLVILIVLAACLILTKDLKKIPDTKRQCAAEYIVKTVNNMVSVNMDKSSLAYAPYIAAVFSYIIVGTLISMIGFRSITADISVTGALAFMTFVLVTCTKLKYMGVGGYFKQFINPLNIIGEVANPVAMALRLFGNVSGGMIITMILYAGLGAASGALYDLIGISPIENVGYVFNIFQVGIPAVLSVYFDLFSGAIQSYVFIMLTMAYIQMGKE
ncbi:MAG: F0F1 ATP synthase subunit A [Oscillospiraceae bacterium]|jgi:F-type H+-transporting ATPase subunit a|nr:F0F1 ATP synthase subunit A [Oscillospiraceae bacterium]